MRGVLDTNVLVSGLAYPQSAPGRIVAAWRSGALDVVLSPYLLDEFARTLPRLNHRLNLSAAEQQDLVDSLALLAEVMTPDPATEHKAELAGLRDAADAPVLATWMAAQAQYLISGDKDLLALADRYPILTPAQFCARHEP
jgi:uncharacterized protein